MSSPKQFFCPRKETYCYVFFLKIRGKICFWKLKKTEEDEDREISGRMRSRTAGVRVDDVRGRVSGDLGDYRRPTPCGREAREQERKIKITGEIVKPFRCRKKNKNKMNLLREPLLLSNGPWQTMREKRLNYRNTHTLHLLYRRRGRTVWKRSKRRGVSVLSMLHHYIIMWTPVVCSDTKFCPSPALAVYILYNNTPRACVYNGYIYIYIYNTSGVSA